MSGPGATGTARLRLDFVDTVLDTAHPPVARFRLFSRGLSPNNTLTPARDLAGSRACVACGNCLDACPVVATRPPEQVVTRTSMVLEHLVAQECRRCYRCIAACPVVDPDLKRYARAYRRPERVVHLLLAVAVVGLALTGIALFHFKAEMAGWLALLLAAVHRALALLFLAVPFLYARLDPAHLRRAVRKTLDWGPADERWLRDFVVWLRTRGRRGAARRGDFNTAQKAWYLFILLILPVFVLSGVPQWIGAPALAPPLVDAAARVHTIVALITDLAVATHLTLKVGWPAARWLWCESAVLRPRPASAGTLESRALART